MKMLLSFLLALLALCAAAFGVPLTEDGPLSASVEPVPTVFPASAVSPFSVPSVSPAVTASPVPTLSPTPSSAPTEWSVTVNQSGTLTEFSVEDYVLHVVAGEVYASDGLEALKAQAVAARTYLAYKEAHGGCSRGGDICTLSGHCQAFASDSAMKKNWGEKYEEYREKLTRAVEETRGEILCYNDLPICALYHSSSVGRTEDCESVFGNKLAYLISVPTEDDNADGELYHEQVFTRAQFTNKIESALGFTPETLSVRVTARDRAGRAETVDVAGKSVSATSFRKALSLRSTDFSVSVSGDTLVFETRGYGHGVGLSQHGAQGMAKKGNTYREILAHYYPGTTLKG